MWVDFVVLALAVAFGVAVLAAVRSVCERWRHWRACRRAGYDSPAQMRRSAEG